MGNDAADARETVAPSARDRSIAQAFTVGATASGRAVLEDVLRAADLLGKFRDEGLSYAETAVAAGTLVDAGEDGAQKSSESLVAGYVPVGRWRESLFAETARRSAASAMLFTGAVLLSRAGLAAMADRLAYQSAYLNRFTGDIRSGRQAPDGTLPNRASMYVASAWATGNAVFAAGRREEGVTSAMRVLGGSGNHCSECPPLAGLGWVPVGEYVPIGSTPCLSRCRCYVIFR